MYLPKGKIFYVAENAVYTYAIKQYDSTSSFDAAQLVTGVPGTPAIPAGTTTTYPVSTNPNAYQEGDDAKAAGYTLGEVVTGSFQMAEGYPSNTVVYETANSISVGADGAIILNSPTTVSFNSDGFPSAASFLGRFIRFSHRGASGSTTPPATTPPFNTTPSAVVYIPENATITHTNGIHAVDRYQPVTGYAAIPAGTTIEYLGKLGDKARVQVVSYVGTGTTGKNNPCSITMPFKIKTAIMLGYEYSYELVSFLHSEYNMSIIVADQLSTEYKNYRGFLRGTSGTGHSQAYGKISDDNKTIYWYFDSGAYNQCNSSGTKYYVLLLG